MQDMTDSVFAESEQARALREIRSRDPSFDMVRFLQHMRADVRVLIKVRFRKEVSAKQQRSFCVQQGWVPILCTAFYAPPWPAGIAAGQQTCRILDFLREFDYVFCACVLVCRRTWKATRR